MIIHSLIFMLTNQKQKLNLTQNFALFYKNTTQRYPPAGRLINQTFYLYVYMHEHNTVVHVHCEAFKTHHNMDILSHNFSF